jgi:hypothetical protein
MMLIIMGILHYIIHYFFGRETIKLEHITELLKYGADPTISDNRNTTAIMCAKTRKLTEISALFDQWIIHNLLD